MPGASSTPAPFDRVLADLRGALSTPDAVCVGIRPLPDETLAFDWQVDGQALEAVLELGRARRAGIGTQLAMGPYRLCTPAGGRDGPRTREVLARIRAAVVKAWHEGLGTWVAPGVDPDRRVPLQRSAGTVGQALASKLAIGVPFWGDWRLAGVRWEAGAAVPEGFRIEVTDGRDGRVVLCACTGEAPAAALVRTSLGPVVHLADRDAPSPGVADGGLLDVLGFLLARSLQDSLDWSATTGDADADDPWRDGLLDNSFRGSIEWYMTPSRFFGMWGYADNFGQIGTIQRYRHFVCHSSRECPITLHVSSRRSQGGVRPWGVETLRTEPDRDYSVFMTDLDDATIAMGGEAKLARLFERVKSAAGEDADDTILLTEGCESHIIGDKPDVVGAKCLQNSTMTLSYLQSRRPGFEEADTRNTWGRLVDDAIAAAPAGRRANAVNLVGFGHRGDAAVRDLEAMLAEAGVEVATVTLPYRDVRGAAAFAGAALSIVSPWQPVHDLMSKPLADRGLPFAELSMPYGWAGTMRWVEAVCAALGLEPPTPALRAAWRARFEAAAGGALRTLAARPIRLAYVHDKGSLTELLSPRFFWGTDPIELAGREGVDVTVVHAPRLERTKVAAPANLARLAEAGVRYLEYPVGTDLADIVAEQGFEAVYCDAGDGVVVKHAGAFPVGIADFSPGLAGCGESLRRLASIRGASLYRRHGRRV